MADTEKSIVLHKFRNHEINRETRILILGTFNPDVPKNKADFFFGGHWNQLWDLLPTAFREEGLKNKNSDEKRAFCIKHKIDFIDIVEAVNVSKGKEGIRGDSYIDKNVVRWKDVNAEIKSLPNLKVVCFTRETFDGIQNIKKKVCEVIDFCKQKNISFEFLISPSPARRIKKEEKQKEWNRVFLGKYSHEQRSSN